MRIRSVILLLLLLFIAEHGPWRLMALSAEVLTTPRGYVRTSNGNDQYWRALDLQGHLEAAGWRVSYDAGILDQGLYGYTDPLDHSIHVDASLSWNARFATLAHEGAHTLQPARLTVNQREVFAESVAALVTRDGLREHARYLALLKADFVTEAIVDWQAIYRAAGILDND